MSGLKSLPNLELMSMQFVSFLVKKKTKNKFYSYLDPLETLKSYESEEEDQDDEANPPSYRGGISEKNSELQSEEESKQ